MPGKRNGRVPTTAFFQRHGPLYPLLPCSQALVARGTHHTGCNSTASRIAIQLRKAGMSLAASEAVLLDWARKNKSPETGIQVTPEELREALEAAFARSSTSLGCSDPAFRPLCSEDCIVYRKTHHDESHEERKP